MKRIVPVFLLLFVCNFLFSQTKFDFSGPISITNYEGSESQSIATINVDGVDYQITTQGSEGRGWSVLPAGVDESMCLFKTGHSYDPVIIRRKDGEPFHFYSLWLHHESIFEPEIGYMPPYYQVTYNKPDGESEFYYNPEDERTSASVTIEKDVVVTSVSVLLPGAMGFRIDDLVVGSASTEIEPLSVTPAQTNVSCFGGSNGSASVSVSGGKAPYSYYWTGVESGGPSATGLASGTYTCTISDAAENSTTQTFFISQPESANIFVSSQPENKTINHGESASFSVIASSVTEYEWQVDNGEGFVTIENEYPYSGANTATLSISGEANIKSGWKYHCVLKNSCSEPVTSNDAKLLVVSDNAFLESLYISPAELNREFSSEVTEYSATVTAATAQVYISAFAYPGASVKINGTPFYDESMRIPLEGGSNEIKVEVTAENGTTKQTYYISVNRPLAKVLSIERANTQLTNQETVTYTVQLSTPVTGLSAENFSFQVDGTLFLYSIESVSKTSETTYNVTVNTGTGDGHLNLSLSNIEGLGVPFRGIPYTGEDGYIVDKTAPEVKGKNISVTLGSTGSATILPYSLNDGSTDNYTSELTFMTDKTTFTGEDLGQHTVILTAKDEAGNRSTTEVVVTVNKDLAYISPVRPINIVYGDAPNLPETVTVLYSDNGEASLPVKWNTETYTGRAGNYSVTGNISLPEFITNSESLHYETEITVSQKQLSVSLEGRISKVYDGTTTATINPSYYILSGVVGEDDVHLNNPETGKYDTKNIGAEKKVTISELALTGESASNYFIESNELVSFSGKITAKELTVQMNEELSIDKVYDANTIASIEEKNIMIEGAVEGDDISVEATGSYSDKNVGENKTITVAELTVTGEDKGNYLLITESASTHGTITPKELTVSLSDQPIEKVYDGSTKAALSSEKLIFDGRIKADDLNLDVEASYDNKNAGYEKTVTINSFKLNGEDKDNYRLMTEQLTTYGAILKKEITLELKNEPAITKVYDGNTNAKLSEENYSLQDVVEGDELTVEGYAKYDNRNAGDDKSVTVTEFGLDGTDKNNYQLLTNELTTSGQITRKEISVVVNATPAISKIYDGSNKAHLSEENYQLEGLAEGDNLEINGIARYSDKNAGENKTITIEDFKVYGEEEGNYLLTTTTVSTLGTIVPKELNVSMSEDFIVKAYDGTPKAILPSEKLILDEQVRGDDLSLEAEAYYDNKNAGSEKSVTINAFKLNGEDKDNYKLMTEQLTTYGYVFQKPITLKLNAEPFITKVYDGSEQASLTKENYNLEDVVKGDDLSVSGQAFYNDRNVGNNKMVSAIEFALDGEDRNNYLLTTREVSTEGSITPKELQVNLVNAENITKIYDGTDEAIIAAGNYEVIGTVKKDDIGINNPTTGHFDDKHAGTSKMVFVDGLMATGEDASNYTLASRSVSAPIGTVIPRDVTINIESKSKVYGSADPSLTYEVDGIVKGESLEGKPARKKGSDVGEYLIDLGTVKGGNDYNITHYQPGTLQITPAELTIVADGKTKDQGNPNPEFTFTYSGFVNGDNANDLKVTPVAQTVASATSPIGYYEIMPSVAASNNYHIKFEKGTLTILPNTHDNSLKVWRTGAGIQVRVFVKEDQKSYAMMVTSTGQTLMVEQKMLKAGINTFTLPLTHLASSTYIISVGSDKFKLAQRIDIK